MVSLDEQALRRLAAEVRDGRADAWPSLIALLDPVIEAMAGASRSMGGLRASRDHCRQVATDALTRLAKHQHRALGLLEPWLAANPDKTPLDWLRIVVTNVIRDHVRHQLGPAAPGDPTGATRRWMHTLAEPLPGDDDAAPAFRPPVTDQQTARAVLEFAEAHLPPAQLAALEAWLHQTDFAEIGRQAGIAREPARGGAQLVRAALARLRRQFAALP